MKEERALTCIPLSGEDMQHLTEALNRGMSLKHFHILFVVAFQLLPQPPRAPRLTQDCAVAVTLQHALTQPAVSHLSPTSAFWSSSTQTN